MNDRINTQLLSSPGYLIESGGWVACMPHPGAMACCPAKLNFFFRTISIKTKDYLKSTSCLFKILYYLAGKILPTPHSIVIFKQ